MATELLLLAVAVSARGAELAVESATLDPGATIALKVALTSGAGESVASLQFDVLFDAAAVSIPEVLPGAAAVAAGKQTIFAPQSTGRIRVIVVGLLSQTIIADGDVADLQIALEADAPDGTYSLTLTSAVLSDPFGGSVPVSVVPGNLTVGSASPHAADSNGDWKISLSEVLRVIQFFSFKSLHCDATTEDGYAPGAGNTDCAAHDSDYQPLNWSVNISEILRLIQLYNNAGYHALNGTEDGFAPNAEEATP